MDGLAAGPVAVFEPVGLAPAAARDRLVAEDPRRVGEQPRGRDEEPLPLPLVGVVLATAAGRRAETEPVLRIADLGRLQRLLGRGDRADRGRLGDGGDEPVPLVVAAEELRLLAPSRTSRSRWRSSRRTSSTSTSARASAGAAISKYSPSSSPRTSSRTRPSRPCRRRPEPSSNWSRRRSGTLLPGGHSRTSVGSLDPWMWREDPRREGGSPRPAEGRRGPADRWGGPPCPPGSTSAGTEARPTGAPDPTLNQSRRVGTAHRLGPRPRTVGGATLRRLRRPLRPS